MNIFRISSGERLTLSQAQWDALAGNPKRADLRLWVTTVAPTPTGTQKVVETAPVIDAINATQTWALVDMTADELEAAALEAEKAQIVGYITDVQTQLDISNATRGAMTTNQRLNTLEADTRVLLKSVKFMLRRIKRQG